MPTDLSSTALVTVKPGDLITATDWNRLVDAVTALLERVTALESSAAGGGAVRISGIVPAGTNQDPIRVSTTLQILGMNFGFSVGLQRVFFNNVPVVTYQSGSSDDRLVVTVPSISGLPLAGSTFVLRVENGRSADTRNVIVVPLQQGLRGNIDVLWRDDLDPNPAPNPVVEEGSAVFGYRLRSRANQVATFLITPTITVGGGPVPVGLSNVQVLNAENQVLSNRQIDLQAGQEKNFFLRIENVPAGPNGTTFTLTVTAAAGTVTGSDAHRFTIGTPVQPSDASIQLAWTAFEGINTQTGGSATASDASFEQGTNTIRVRQGFFGKMLYSVTFQTAGSYDVTVRTGNGTTNWRVALFSTPEQYTNEPAGQSENPQFAVEPQPGASQTGEVSFDIRRRGATIGQTRSYALQLIL